MAALKVALVVFIVAALVFIVVTGFRRWRADRDLVDLSEPLQARYGTTMSGWPGAIEGQASRTVAEETINPDPPGRLT
ncbi:MULTISPECIES: hypothetical protein [Mycolicibacterium]|uniref:Uncharacterized protein n=2 Tax=Mycolicibacterium TaxID=1866885 RepID=A0A2U9PHM8_MYCSE|nr:MULTISPECIES: hypothetical protein [Mycolicibacterium]OKH64831.1 hypothetical protein EB74_08595 [Mycobacterium sp. SWH-M5]AWT51237.1 hypothetical protein D806_002430 [Mycolicibacterium smegmatis MKD8]MBU8810638.1 hypothetical protein [Mycolicibacterium goodii]MBU8822689.1 hypothetical protein [Mycolicibacterium goodii]MBU8829086.1 hypothetical protein [Mycolicibacterium goodii]